MKSVLVLAAATLTAAACSHAQPPPPPAPAEPIVQAAPPLPPSSAPEAKRAPAPLSVEIVMTSVYFGFDSSELSAQARDTLQAFFDLAQQRPDQNLRIEGNCDERGTREYNLALGQRRADAARTYLLNLGLEPSRITTISYGEERPRAPGHDKAAWRQNRRDDLMAVTTAVSEAR
ncbi:MAG: peptidoglycan-associated lipoprotein [Chloroflexi bacterium 13_1_40CM_2_68_14]|nr:MAG: peptidoglycan-associated lipoprotein [Chloroflexi bacterium 13_1_40CM_2_68_14]